MTLINYLTRIHFADGVLEEALRSEMERHDKRRPLIVAEEGDMTGAVAERFFGSFPVRTRAETFTAIPHRANEAAALEVRRRYQALDCDLLIAFGSNRAMDLAKAARISIAYDDEPIAALTHEEGGAHRITNALPDLYSIPTVLGFASAATNYTRVRLEAGGQALLSSSHLIPNVAICDPTLTYQAAPTETAWGAAGVLARGVDGLLAPGYNPPADAMAADAIGRCVRSAQRSIRDDNRLARREMMAASLNSALALQKGLCPVHALSNAVAAVSAAPIDPSALGGVLIPRLVTLYESWTPGRLDPIRRSLGLAADAPVGPALAQFLGELPLATTLGGLGVLRSDLDAAADLAVADRAIGNCAIRLDRSIVVDLLEDAFGPSMMAETCFG